MKETIATLTIFDAFVDTTVTCPRVDGSKRAGFHHRKLYSETSFLYVPAAFAQLNQNIDADVKDRFPEKLTVFSLSEYAPEGLAHMWLRAQLKWKSVLHPPMHVSPQFLEEGFRNISRPVWALFMTTASWGLKEPEAKWSTSKNFETQLSPTYICKNENQASTRKLSGLSIYTCLSLFVTSLFSEGHKQGKFVFVNRNVIVK